MLGHLYPLLKEQQDNKQRFQKSAAPMHAKNVSKNSSFHDRFQIRTDVTLTKIEYFNQVAVDNYYAL